MNYQACTLITATQSVKLLPPKICEKPQSKFRASVVSSCTGVNGHAVFFQAGVEQLARRPYH